MNDAVTSVKSRRTAARWGGWRTRAAAGGSAAPAVVLVLVLALTGGLPSVGPAGAAEPDPERSDGSHTAADDGPLSHWLRDVLGPRPRDDRPAAARDAGTPEGGGERTSRDAPRFSRVNAESGFAPVTPLGPVGAVTYDTEAVPPGARIGVRQWTDPEGTTVWLRVSGLEPGRAYGAHVHTRPCGAEPDSSGPHYQHRRDPEQPSTDPRYANPDNEVWLDFTAGDSGDGAAEARQDWNFRPGEARSVVLHEHTTATEDGAAGTAGARLACFTVPFAAQR
ncbi:superoxide dismutase family protein [Streptomyces sp. WAC 00631]|uniref:superoxide dismutase family protein n=1 Tax=unclassified Streptomyces TaxID=2593676 RepID=UPI00100311A3|nr:MULTISPECIES: superoxide dismutase family protein [unclassified Streptomyces]MCC5034790.1 superoxide dismutase family protein [Streptomyces sp. WAC 00631]MCC9741849.1 superoxide dismutase family protein [Streptomyces sp. MNU89]